MKKGEGDNWLITDENEFRKECLFAKRVIDYVEKNENTKAIKWFFQSCNANWEEGKHIVNFHSWKIPGYFENYLLSVSVQGTGKDKYEIQTINKIESTQIKIN